MESQLEHFPPLFYVMVYIWGGFTCWSFTIEHCEGVGWLDLQLILLRKLLKDEGTFVCCTFNPLGCQFNTKWGWFARVYSTYFSVSGWVWLCELESNVSQTLIWIPLDISICNWLCLDFENGKSCHIYVICVDVYPYLIIAVMMLYFSLVYTSTCICSMYCVKHSIIPNWYS